MHWPNRSGDWKNPLRAEVVNIADIGATAGAARAMAGG